MEVDISVPLWPLYISLDVASSFLASVPAASTITLLLLSGIIILDISPVQGYPPLLAVVFLVLFPVMLLFIVWAVSYNSSTLLVALSYSVPLISSTLMYGGVFLLFQKRVTPTMSYLLMIIRDIPRSILCHLWLVSDYLPAVCHYDSHSVRFSHSCFSS